MTPPFSSFEPEDPSKKTEGSARGPRLRDISLRMMVPNIITVLAIGAGLTAVRLAFEGRFELAVAMVLIAAVLDGVDGRVARLLKSTSTFGAQMDSLADVINFGVAPALVLYAYILDQAHSFGWIAALLYAVSAALRLARFNTMSERPSKQKWLADYFIGIPAPGGAMLVLLPVYSGFLGISMGGVVPYLAAIYTVFIGFLMISRFPIYSGKSLGQRIRKDMVMPLLLVAVAYVGLLFSFMWETMFVTALSYFAFLPFSVRAWSKKHGKAARKSKLEAGENGNSKSNK